MPSIFDERRKALGLTGGDSISSPSSGSMFDSRRMDLGLLEDTRPNKAKEPYKMPTTIEGKPITIGNAINDFNKQHTVLEAPTVKGRPSSVKPAAKSNFSHPAEVDKPKKEWMAKESAARDKQLEGAPGFIKKPLQLLGKGLDYVQANVPGLADFQQGAGNALGIKADTAPTTGGTVGKVAKGVGMLAGYGVNPAALEQSLFTGGYNIANSALSTKAGMKVLGAAERGLARGANVVNPALNRAGINIGSNLTNKFAERALTGGIASAYQNTALEAAKGNTSAKELGTAVLTGGVFGAAGDVAAHGIGGAFMKLFKRNGIADDVAAKEVENILALPMGREDAARLRRAPQVGTGEPIANPYTFGLPEPKVAQPVATSARIGQRTNPWREKYNQLIGLAHETKFTPGRELEELEQLWSSIAGREDPSLDELIKLAHPTYVNKVKPGLVNEAREYQAARDVAGAPLPIKRTEPIPQGVIADAAPLTQKVGRAPNVKKPIEEPVMNVTEPPPVNPPKVEPPPIQKADEPAVHEPDDVADDLIPDEPDEVSIRVRDKWNATADDLIAQAKKQWQSKQNLGFAAKISDPDAVILSKMAAGYMLKGVVKLADLTEAMVRDLGEDVRPHVRAIFKKAKEEYKQMKVGIEKQELGLGSLNLEELKDLSSYNNNMDTVYHNFKKVFGKHFPEIKKAILDPFDKSKGEYASEQKNLTDKLYKDVVKGFGIQKGSKESALVQKYGERMMDEGYKQLYEDGKLSREMLDQFNLEKLKEQAPKDWERIAKTEEWFRAEYKRLIDRVNKSVAKIYPNRPEKLVPERADYFHHFKELSAIGGIQNLFDSASGKINAKLSGITQSTKPKSKYAGFKQKRGMGEFKNDAVGGFLKYIPAASYAIHIDPHISVFRNLAKRVGEDTEKTGNLNNFKEFLEDFANDLSGKTSDIDRWMLKILRRRGTNILLAANNRVKSNVILGSLRSTLAQTANIPAGIAFAKHHSAEGAWRTIASIRRPNPAMDASDFMRERYVGKNFRRFNTKMLDQPRNFAEWMMETVDRLGTSFVWNSAYAKGKALKVADPVKYADEHTRRLVAGRGVGEVPLLQKTKTMQLFAPFQLEVGNLWRVMKDSVSEKDFVGIATLFVANFLLNKGIEKTTGSGVTFDPIEAVIEASEEDLNPLERAGRVFGEVLSNVPGGQTFAAMYPEYGMSTGGLKLPTRKKLFGDNDPTRFGGGLLVGKGLADPIFKMLPSFGGNQLKKTITGGESLIRGGAYKENALTAGSNLLDKNEFKFKVNRNFPDAAQALAFGPTATGGGQEYYKKERRPLSEDQTELYRSSPEPDAVYDLLMKKREIETAKGKIKEIFKDKNMSDKRKDKEIAKLEAKIEKIISSVK